MAQEIGSDPCGCFRFLYIKARLETSDGDSREKAQVERFQRRRGSGASSLVHGIFAGIK